jgi:hypothetical protein
MKNVQITLPDDLARDAADAGLLSGSNLEQMLREAVKAIRRRGLRSAMEATSGAAMSPEDVAAEIAKFRAERRTQPSAH